MPKQEIKLTKLIGDQCTINCLLDGRNTTALWDTGSQVSLLPKYWLENHTEKVVRPISQITGDRIDLRAANGTRLDFTGWIDLAFSLPGDSEDPLMILVPFLVVDDPQMARPLLGYNVIKEYVNAQGEVGMTTTTTRLAHAFPDIPKRKLGSLSAFIQSSDTEDICHIKTGRRKTTIPRQSTVKIWCGARIDGGMKGMLALFEPNIEAPWSEGLHVSETVLRLPSKWTSKIAVTVSNTTQHEVTLPARLLLGHLQPVKAVFPVPKKPVIENHQEEVPVRVAEVRVTDTPWDPPVDLDNRGLSSEQKSAIKKKIRCLFKK